MSGPVPPITQARLCARPECPRRYNPAERQTGTPIRYCSRECFLADKPVPTPRPRAQLPHRLPKPQARSFTPASVMQRAVIADRACVVCDKHAGACHPAHLIARGELSEGQNDPRAVIPLCPVHHREYDQDGLSILEHLEPRHRDVLAFAVERFGLIRTLERVTNERWAPVPMGVEDSRAC